ncbi:MAG: tetratricopeptide repeat protein [Candidatus Mcinerneyibacterium aminivorans]|jgi:tetratricopeptide (TPR) repeat protein|uniref:Tetratricopeptide repeat protein n=1 Tax=Candidatus Mcinerneyibacterium aminivorans TaxID=2703815 RepID=A0A5D0MJ63_9BACT|nr:MAG: tetratricopeptide repeat protein [Candidatus Mcinerneyibacterium aminivorans]
MGDKKYLYLIIIILLFTGFVFSDALKAKAERANKLYQQQKYEKALEIYKSIEKEVDSFGIYYNIANTYFKMDNMAHAKLYYLKALKIKPDSKTALTNLKLVRGRLKNQIKTPDKNLFNKILEKISHIFNLNISAFLSFLLMMISSVVFYSKKFKNRKIILSVSIFLLILFIFFTGISYLNYSRVNYVYLNKKTEAKSEPNADSTSVFTVHGGNEFHIKNRTGDWYLIVLKNGYTGWIKVNNQNQIGQI